MTKGTAMLPTLGGSVNQGKPLNLIDIFAIV
jgi:hypothetical protein